MADIKKLDKFKFPTPMDNFEKQVVLLAQDLELALQQGLMPMQIKEQVISKFPKMTISGLKMFTVAQINGFLSEKAPPDWAIVSPAGKKMLEAMHPLL